MTGYIIDPMTFYWIHVVDTLQTLLLFLLAGGTAFSAFLLPLWHMEIEGNAEQEKLFRKVVKTILIILPVLALFLVFIPSKTTMIEMLVAKYSTYENASLTVEGIKSLIDYIVEALAR